MTRRGDVRHRDAVVFDQSPDFPDQFQTLDFDPLAVTLGSATLVTVAGTSGGTSIRAAQLADAATQGVFRAFRIPRNAKPGSPLLIQPVWSPVATDAVVHSVRWEASALAIATGVAVGATAVVTPFSGIAQANVVDQPVFETPVQVLASVNPGDLIRLRLNRLGSDGADTFVGAVNLLILSALFTLA